MELKDIILIDDSFATNIYHEKILKKKLPQLKVHRFTEAKKALDLLLSSNIKLENALTYLDINMPEMDAWEFLADLREKKQSDQAIKIIILTTGINQEELDRSKNYPEIIDFQLKPLQVDLLKKIGSQHFEG